MLSTLYAICTAFLLWKGLTDHDVLRQLLRDEANQIQRIVGLLNYFDGNVSNVNGPHSQKIRRLFHSYISNILRKDRVAGSDENLPILQSVMDTVQEMQIQDKNDEIALSEIIKGVSDLMTIRSKRISQMEIKMSPFLSAALVVMSVSILYPFFTESPYTAVGETDYVNAFCIFILGALLSFLQMTLFDISRPFDGYWAIKVDSYDRLLQELGKDIAASGA